MPDTINISIIIPTYNRCELLEQALGSIPRLDSRVKEIIVVDDGSTDATVNLLTAKYPYVRLIHQANLGPGSARNRGLDVASGNWISFLDSDDLWLPWTLDQYENAINATQPDILFGKPFLFEDPYQVESLIYFPAIQSWKLFKDYYASGDKWRWWGASSFVVNRAALGSVRFSESSINAEDADWIMKLGHQKRLVQITGSPTFAYRLHDGSVQLNWHKTLNGAWTLINNERTNVYPGGFVRHWERTRILGRHIRPLILRAFKDTHFPEAKMLLLKTWWYHLSHIRFRFLFLALFLLLKGNR
ncbi:MAG: glycosyltransferase family 2 protein [Balneolales bacterium]